MVCVESIHEVKRRGGNRKQGENIEEQRGELCLERKIKGRQMEKNLKVVWLDGSWWKMEIDGRYFYFMFIQLKDYVLIDGSW